MILLITSVTCYLLGTATGILIYRNNITKLKAAEEKAKAVLAAVKK